jgi:hypothetical protein
MAEVHHLGRGDSLVAQQHVDSMNAAEALGLGFMVQGVRGEGGRWWWVGVGGSRRRRRRVGGVELRGTQGRLRLQGRGAIKLNSDEGETAGGAADRLWGDGGRTRAPQVLPAGSMHVVTRVARRREDVIMYLNGGEADHTHSVGRAITRCGIARRRDVGWCLGGERGGCGRGGSRGSGGGGAVMGDGGRSGGWRSGGDCG